MTHKASCVVSPASKQKETRKAGIARRDAIAKYLLAIMNTIACRTRENANVLPELLFSMLAQSRSIVAWRNWLKRRAHKSVVSRVVWVRTTGIISVIIFPCACVRVIEQGAHVSRDRNWAMHTFWNRNVAKYLHD